MQIEIEISVDFNMLEKITFELLAAHSCYGVKEL
jgi:hypothetical protein